MPMSRQEIRSQGEGCFCKREAVVFRMRPFAVEQVEQDEGDE